MKDRIVLQMNDVFNEKDTSIYIKSYMFIKGVAIARNYTQTLIALAVARRMHEGQYRKDGTPYFVHPLKVCSTLINYGIDDDAVLASALLHDVLEDCKDKLPMGGKELVSEYGLSHEVFEIITLLTKEQGLDDYELSVYFDKIKRNPKALLVKLSDRLHNSCTLYSFTPEKMKKYLRETNIFIIEIARYGKNYYPQYTNAFSILKSNIYSLVHTLEVVVENYDKHIAELEAEIEKLKNR